MSFPILTCQTSIMKTKGLLLSLTVLVFQLTVSAQPRTLPIINPTHSKWVFIARTETKLNVDKDIVTIRGKNAFRALKFKVTNNPIEIYDLDVVFDNGQHQDIAVKNTFQPNSESRVLDLPGNTRRIKSIVIKYRSQGNLLNQKAFVQFWGMR